MNTININSPYVQELIRNVMIPIEDAGFKCYFVGGCVRDALMGIEPHDYDFCTNAMPSELHRIFSEFSDKSVNSEERGVSMPYITIDGKREIVEIATFRKDGATIDGRHTYVEFGGVDIYEDAERRDLTINALYADKDGNVLDPTGQGIEDIKNKELRFVGDTGKRISEDYLRAFRICRFQSKTGFEISDQFWAIGQGAFRNVSKERQGEEFIKLMSGKYPSIAVRSMLKHGIFNAMGWGKYIDDLMIDHNKKYHKEGNVWEHTVLAMSEMEKLPHDWIDMAAIFFHDFGKKEARDKNNGKNMSGHDTIGAKMVSEILTNLRMSGKDIELISWLVENHMKVNTLPIMTSKLEIWKLLSDTRFPRLEKVGICDARATVNDGNSGPGVLERSINPKVREVEGLPMPERILTGDILIKKFGMKPGKQVGRAIELAYVNQINGELDTAEKIWNAIRNCI